MLNKRAVIATESLGTLDSHYEVATGRRLLLFERINALLQNEVTLGYVLMVPALALIVIFIAYPFGLGIWMSLTDKMVGRPGNFIGLGNFRHLFQSGIFWQAAWNTVIFTLSATILKAVLGMWLAVLLNRKFQFFRLIRATILLPFIVPTVLSGLAWLWIFDATFSVINWLLRWMWQMDLSLFGVLLKENWGYFRGPLWLGDPFLAMLCIIIVNTWRGIPFFAITFLAGLQTVPLELYDAGEIDGTNEWQKFWHITLPIIKPIAVVVVVFSLVVTFADFQVVYVLTRGGPHNSTHLFGTLAYQLGMASGNLGEGAAASLFMFPILALVILWQLLYLRKEGAN
ncbi:MAG: sugar ABC transporter permease [Candidatus Tectomicrobia bacterium]|nr:sugar ABC transporter permease [Candidatus Tectomicrobia bacterium]